MRKDNPIDFTRLISTALHENPFYNHLFESIGKIIDEQIGEPLMQLARARRSTHIMRGDFINVDGKRGKVAKLVRKYDEDGNPVDEITLQLTNGGIIKTTRRALQTRETLINSTRYFGFDYYSDFLKDEDLARITDYVNEYWPHDGEPEFIKFIGFIKSLALDIHTLWTPDKGDNATSDDENISKYDSFEQKSDSIKSVTQGGLWYPTSHREITYDMLLSNTIDDDLVLLFYVLAPIHLVLERISGSINIDLNYTLIPSADIHLVDSGWIEIGDFSSLGYENFLVKTNSGYSNFLVQNQDGSYSPFKVKV